MLVARLAVYRRLHRRLARPCRRSFCLIWLLLSRTQLFGFAVALTRLFATAWSPSASPSAARPGRLGFAFATSACLSLVTTAAGVATGLRARFGVIAVSLAACNMVAAAASAHGARGGLGFAVAPRTEHATGLASPLQYRRSLCSYGHVYSPSASRPRPLWHAAGLASRHRHHRSLCSARHYVAASASPSICPPSRPFCGASRALRRCSARRPACRGGGGGCWSDPVRHRCRPDWYAPHSHSHKRACRSFARMSALPPLGCPCTSRTSRWCRLDCGGPLGLSALWAGIRWLSDSTQPPVRRAKSGACLIWQLLRLFRLRRFAEVTTRSRLSHLLHGGEWRELAR